MVRLVHYTTLNLFALLCTAGHAKEFVDIKSEPFGVRTKEGESGGNGIEVHVFEEKGGKGGLSQESIAGTSQLCFDDADHDQCQYLFLNGSGVFSIASHRGTETFELHGEASCTESKCSSSNGDGGYDCIASGFTCFGGDEGRAYEDIGPVFDYFACCPPNWDGITESSCDSSKCRGDNSWDSDVDCVHFHPYAETYYGEANWFVASNGPINETYCSDGYEVHIMATAFRYTCCTPGYNGPVTTNTKYLHSKVLPLGQCNHQCNNDQHQVVFVGRESTLYNNDNGPVEKEFIHKRDPENNAEGKENGITIKVACINVSKCYTIIGDATYAVTDYEGTTLEEGHVQNYDTIGNKSNCGSPCDNKPLLGDTKWGKEVVLAVSSVSGMEMLTDTGSPQYRAACWMIHADTWHLHARHYNLIQ